MRTEINGDWIGYLKRFKLPPLETFKTPLLRFFICFLCQSLIAGVSYLLYNVYNAQIAIWLLPCVSSSVMITFLYALFKDFWNSVLVEAKGFFADLMMWGIFILLTGITIAIPLIVVLLLLK